jgi:2-methylcitrate dehydratase PrpD
MGVTTTAKPAPPAAVHTAGITRQLAARSSALCYNDLPEDVRLRIRQCLLDWIGVTLAGACEPLVHMLAEEAREQGGHAQATVVGHALTTSSRQAALINGSASHALDYDDVNMACTGHPSVVLIPALLALAESRGASGRDFMTAFAAGYETMCQLGLACGGAQYSNGFHTTATLGTLAATRCRRHRDRAEHRQHHGGWAEVDVRHHVQTLACRAGQCRRPAGGPVGRARLHQPYRCD